MCVCLFCILLCIRTNCVCCSFVHVLVQTGVNAASSSKKKKLSDQKSHQKDREEDSEEDSEDDDSDDDDDDSDSFSYRPTIDKTINHKH